LLKREQALKMANSTRKRGGFFQNDKVTNARQMAQLIGTQKQKVLAKAQSIRK
jgi:hypothetical protein